jgi:hypothetical protein
LAARLREVVASAASLAQRLAKEKRKTQRSLPEAVSRAATAGTTSLSLYLGLTLAVKATNTVSPPGEVRREEAGEKMVVVELGSRVRQRSMGCGCEAAQARRRARSAAQRMVGRDVR